VNDTPPEAKTPPVSRRPLLAVAATMAGAAALTPLDALTASSAQRAAQPLTIPVLGIGGEKSWAERAGQAMQSAATHVQTLVIPGVGHWVAEQAPQEMLAALTTFLAPYRAAAASRSPR
jgi:pimeloyl-ACP methyl ester carboxylesterase